MKTLSVAQSRMLDRLAAATDQTEMTPGEYSTAGRDAAAWHRTAESLRVMGLVTVTRNGCCSLVRLVGEWHEEC